MVVNEGRGLRSLRGRKGCRDLVLSKREISQGLVVPIALLIVRIGISYDNWKVYIRRRAFKSWAEVMFTIIIDPKSKRELLWTPSFFVGTPSSTGERAKIPFTFSLNTD